MIVNRRHLRNSLELLQLMMYVLKIVEAVHAVYPVGGGGGGGGISIKMVGTFFSTDQNEGHVYLKV